MDGAELARRVNLVGPWLRGRFGGPVAKVGLDPGFGCPHRGPDGRGGCTFCPPSGSGQGQGHLDLGRQLEEGIARLEAGARRRGRSRPHVLAYYQAHTATHASPRAMERMLAPALEHAAVEGIIVSTRPDCLDEARLEILARTAEQKFFWLELGLQSAHDSTLRAINRGHDRAAFERALELARRAGLNTVAHVILGLPGEDEAMAWATADYLAGLGLWGVKLHSLMVLEQTALAESYRRGEFQPWGLARWAGAAAGFLARLPRDMLIHRLAADPGRDVLLAPAWVGDKNRALEALLNEMKAGSLTQGGLPRWKK